MYVFKKQNPKQRYDAFLDGAYDMKVLKIAHITPNIHQTKDMLHRMETINVKLVRRKDTNRSFGQSVEVYMERGI